MKKKQTPRSSKDRKPKAGAPKSGGPFRKKAAAPRKIAPKPPSDDSPMRLNKYISNSGVCSRRDADVMISTGVVTVNGEVITEMGYKVNPGDVVKYDGQTIKPEKLQYVLLNKPKNFLVAVADPQGRRTVMELVKNTVKEQVLPIDKMDRSDTGLLLFTNDSQLVKRLLDGKNKVSKLYHVTLGEKVKRSHLDEMIAGFELEGSFVKAEEATFIGDGSDAHQVGLRIASNRNNIVRRMFTRYGYSVQKLDRVMYAGLTKKDLPRGYARALSREEVGMVYMST